MHPAGEAHTYPSATSIMALYSSIMTSAVPAPRDVSEMVPFYAQAAVVAQGLIHPHGQQGDPCEQGIDGPQGTQKPTAG